MIYKGAEQPESIGEHLLSDEIRSVYSGNGYVGLVFRGTDSNARYRMDVYDSGDNLVEKCDIDFEYTDVLFEDSDLVIYNESSCMIYTYKGKVKYNESFRDGVRLMIPTDKAYRYVLSTSSAVETIRLN